ncbi:hypothetical protein DLJ49_00295 [Rhodovulum sp. 12E13]|nr:hypothetical protein DLJ49_00295 [Rhodovulum sp. 12E13]
MHRPCPTRPCPTRPCPTRPRPTRPRPTPRCPRRRCPSRPGPLPGRRPCSPGWPRAPRAGRSTAVLSRRTSSRRS